VVDGGIMYPWFGYLKINQLGEEETIKILQLTPL
jgi:hypothetical protein